MHLSVVVCTYNRAAGLSSTLAALARQEVPVNVNWEIVVVDNNSRDHTREVVEKQGQDARIPIRYYFEGRQGLSHARNLGMSMARGEIIAFTDDDVQPESQWVANLVDGMDRWKADAIGGQILPSWEVEPPRWLKRNRQLLDLLALTDFDRPQVLALPLAGHPQIWGANMAFRRSFLDRAGLFDANRGPIGNRPYQGDEIDFIKRGLERGLKAVYDPVLKVWHHVPAERIRRRYFRMRSFYPGEAAGLRFRDRSKFQILGVPMWAIGYLLRACCSWLGASLGKRHYAFSKELDVMERLGFIWGCAKRHRRPDQGSGAVSDQVH